MLELLDLADEYRIFAGPTYQTSYEVTFVIKDEFAKVLAKHGIGSNHTLPFWVIACSYLTPRQIEAFGVDPKRLKQKLLLAAYNASKLSTPSQIRNIAQSLQQFGWPNPITVDGENTIIFGHGRLEAAKQIGHESGCAAQYRETFVAQPKSAGKILGFRRF